MKTLAMSRELSRFAQRNNGKREAFPGYQYKTLDPFKRPWRSAHQALDSFWQQTMPTGSGWVLEVDIRMLFEALDSGHWRVFVQKRVRQWVL